jgi:putative ABC transport system substrate-binding protein
MRRRDLITLVGSAAAWPASLRAQPSAKPAIGYLSTQSLGGRPQYLGAFRRGLAAEGFVEASNVAIEFRPADGNAARLPELAADLVQRRVAVIGAFGPPAALAAKRATQSVPIVFTSGADPVQIGLVSSFNRPGGNITGVYFLYSELVAKRLALLHELAPRTKRIAVLVNPTNASDSAPTVSNATATGHALGLEIQVFNASTGGEIDAAFAAILKWRPDALLVGPDPFFSGRDVQFTTLAQRHALPASYFNRYSVAAGGLMSYGPDVSDSYRQAGVYVARILKGARPGDLPVVQPTKYELVINLKTAKALGLTVPPLMLELADEVIE